MTVPNSYAPFTGFGDQPNTMIKFTIEHPGNAFPQWSGGPRLSTLEIPGGDDIDQFMGRDPWTIRFRVWFQSLEDMERLDDKQGTHSTLMYLYGLTKRVGGTKYPYNGANYLLLPGTLLVSMTEEVIEVGGTFEATLTFRRPYVAQPVIEPQPYPEAPWPYTFGFGEGPFGLEPFGNDPEDV